MNAQSVRRDDQHERAENRSKSPAAAQTADQKRRQNRCECEKNQVENSRHGLHIAATQSRSARQQCWIQRSDVSERNVTCPAAVGDQSLACEQIIRRHHIRARVGGQTNPTPRGDRNQRDSQQRRAGDAKSRNQTKPPRGIAHAREFMFNRRTFHRAGACSSSAALSLSPAPAPITSTAMSGGSSTSNRRWKCP